MRWIDRFKVDAPACLMGPHVENWKYGELGQADRAQIRDAFDQINGPRCAYCERTTPLTPDDGHIEHFLGQAEYPDRTLDWTNMHWSCNDEDSCGKHKDKCVRQAGPLRSSGKGVVLDPSGPHDPETFLFFLDDGTVRPREPLSASDRNQAEETLRVLRLNDHADLKRDRKKAIKPYVDLIIDLQIVGADLSAHRELLIASSRAKPFCTAIKQVLEAYL